MAGEPAFFELGVEDLGKARTFYGSLFGWSFEPGPNGEAGGSMITTDGIPGGLHGGDQGARPYLYFRVDDLEAALARVRELGGTVGEIDEGDAERQAAIGRWVSCSDDQGSWFGLHQPPVPPVP
jgi:predicted enzyme related to lactoylglutathione lyase